MWTFAQRVWREPAVAAAVVVAALNIALLLPDWRAAIASVAVTLAAGAGVRHRVQPV